jgi:hypothetical protein
MNPPAIGPGFFRNAALVFRIRNTGCSGSETLVAACTKVIWEGDTRVQEAEMHRFFHAPALDF